MLDTILKKCGKYDNLRWQRTILCYTNNVSWLSLQENNKSFLLDRQGQKEKYYGKWTTKYTFKRFNAAF